MSCHLFALRQRRVADRGGAGNVLPVVRRLGRRTEAAVRCLCRGEAATECPRLRRSAALLGADGQRSGPCRRDRRALRPCARRRVSGHEPPSGLDPAGAEARRARPHRGRRRCAVDLFVSRRDGAQHPRFSEAVQPAGCDHHARPELSLDAADPRRRQRRDRSRARALHQKSLDRPHCRRAAAARRRSRRERSRRTTSSRACWRTARAAPC